MKNIKNHSRTTSSSALLADRTIVDGPSAGQTAAITTSNRKPRRVYSSLAGLALLFLTFFFASAGFASAAATFSYALTTSTDRVRPGQIAQFVVSLTNLTSATQSATMNFTVPKFTTYNGSAAGVSTYLYFSSVPAGGSQSAFLDLTVLGGSSTPPDGSVITLVTSDLARSASVTRTVTVRAAPLATLDLSINQGTVAPGGTFTYGLTYHNATSGTLSGTQVRLPLPTGASFVSADSGGVLGSDGIVRWSPATLSVGGSGQVHVTLKAAASTSNGAALLLQAVYVDVGGHVLAQASSTKAIYIAPTFSYAVTTTTDPVKPGQVAQFTVTATNLTTTTQYAYCSFHVPNFTTYNGSATGVSTYLFFSVPAGGSQSGYVDLSVLGGSSAPPDGSIITLAVSDLARSGSVSRSVTIKSAPLAALDLFSTSLGTVTPGGDFSYGIIYHNSSGATLSGSQLSLAVPVGSSFVTADGGGVLGSDGVVRWSPGALAAGASGQVHVTLKAANSTVNGPALLVQAIFLDSAGHTLAQASGTKAIYIAPALSYLVTTTTDPVKPGQVAQFKVTVTNLSTATQYAYCYFHVPNFTTYNGSATGASTYLFFSVPAGESQSAYLDLTVLGGSSAPPDGSIITLVVNDLSRAASVSRSVTVKSVPAAALDLSTAQGTVAAGGNFTYALTYHNSSGGTLSGTQLSVAVRGAESFVSADGGGLLGSDGIVRWSPGTLASGASGQVHLTLKASNSTVNGPALLIQAVLLDSTNHILAQASDARAIYIAPALSYAVTTTTDPVKPGQIAQFKLTVSNLSTTAQTAYCYFHVPNFTTYNGSAAGAYTYLFFSVAAGGSQSAFLDLPVLGGSSTPPDGSIITLVVSDLDRGGSVSRSILLKAAPLMSLDLSSGQGTVAPGGTFSYGLTYHNSSAATISGSQLSVPVPAGSSFVSATGGGVLGSDGVVRWSPGTVVAGASRQVHLTLKAANSTLNGPALLVQSILLDSTGHILAQASDTKAIYAAPALSYAITTTTDPVKPGQIAHFVVTLTNLSTAAQSAYCYFHVPNFTTYNGYTAGTATYLFFSVAAGGTQSGTVDLTVLGGTSAPPNGSIITLAMNDQARAASFSHSIGVNQAIVIAANRALRDAPVWMAPEINLASLLCSGTAVNKTSASPRPRFETRQLNSKL